MTFSTKKYTVSPAHLRRQCKSVLIIYDDGIDLIFAHIEFFVALPLLKDMAEPFGVAPLFSLRQDDVDGQHSLRVQCAWMRSAGSEGWTTRRCACLPVFTVGTS